MTRSERSCSRSLQDDGIDVSGVKHVNSVATGIASIYVAEGDNSIVVVPGANFLVEPADIDRNEDKLQQADIVMLQLEIPIETVVYAARKAKALGKIVVLNPAPAQQLPEELFGFIDYLTPNRTEPCPVHRDGHRRGRAGAGHAKNEGDGRRSCHHNIGG